MRSISRKGHNPLDLIPIELGQYLAGFADGEGSFNVSFKRQNDIRLGWKASPSFNISQRDDSICKLFQRTLRVGTIRYRRDGVCYFEVRSIVEINEKVIPFFQRFQLRSWKRHDFVIFSKITRIMKRREHRTPEGLNMILRLRNQMNRGGNRKIADRVIQESLRNVKSSETIRQTSSRESGIG